MQVREEMRLDSMCPRDGGGGTVDGEGGAHCVSK